MLLQGKSTVEVFQFQYGAIESIIQCAEYIVHPTDFNSSMVRLKVDVPFMSIVPSIFQFQYGAIERRLIFGPDSLKYSYFNSSMVRLKETI